MVYLEDPSQLAFASISLHADDGLSPSADVAPAINVSTTFIQSGDPANPSPHIYSRQSSETRNRVEQVLGLLNKGHAITYSSGLSAGYAGLLHVKPNRVAIRGGYHGTHGFIEIYKRHRDIDIIDIDDELQEGDLLWLESPLNPTGEVLDVVAYSERAHKVGATVLLDSTFAPPPLAWPIELATKYFAGHSDSLGGVLIVKSENDALVLRDDRTNLGSVLGSLETWLLLRSLRTLKIRVLQQSQTATALTSWLAQAADGKEHDGIPANAIHKVLHASLQDVPWDIQKQFPGGYGATFSVLLTSKEAAEALPLRLRLFRAATSLGGVESLAEWRFPLDSKVDERLVRISVGLEELDDLKHDWRQALTSISKQT
ncbi:hypothetical protein VKS41_003629 [Umbelopsis sp. WA50703]